MARPRDFTGVWRRWYVGGMRGFSTYEAGKLHGPNKLFYSNGVPCLEFNWQHGHKHGVGRVWYENGQLRVEDHWKEGELDGRDRYWDMNGKLVADGVRRDGRPWEGTFLGARSYGDAKGVFVETYRDGAKVGQQPVDAALPPFGG
ncbi:toxin-antitoxin system YwqK family antitoxin [Planctomycetota bacterium]